MVGKVEDAWRLTRRTLQEKCNIIALLIIKLSAMRQKGSLNIHLEPSALLIFISKSKRISVQQENQNNVTII